MNTSTLETIKRVIREVTMAPPPPVEQPVLQRQAPARQYSRTVQGAEGRFGGGSGTLKTTSTNVGPRAAPPKPISSTSMEPSKPSSVRVGSSFSQGRGDFSKMGDKLDTVSRNISKGYVPSTPTSLAGRAAGGVLKALSGPVATAAMAVMDPTPAGEKKSEFQRQADIAKGVSYKPQGRSISQIEKDINKPAETKKATLPDIKVGGGKTPTPPSRPEYFTRGQAFKAARSEVGGGTGKFTYGGKEYQTNVSGEKYKPAAKLKTTSVVDTESGKYRK